MIRCWLLFEGEVGEGSPMEGNKYKTFLYNQQIIQRTSYTLI